MTMPTTKRLSGHVMNGKYGRQQSVVLQQLIYEMTVQAAATTESHLDHSSDWPFTMP